MKKYSLNCNGRLVEMSRPEVMGILNVTPDSFYAGSRVSGEEQIARRTRQVFDEGARIIDVGAYSSRPGADEVSPEEEMHRLRVALSVVCREKPSNGLVSVDTFRADVARMCVEEYGVDIINDISGGEMDGNMFRTVARLGVPYILMHMQGTPATMQDHPQYDDPVRVVSLYLARRVARLREMGACDIIIDPGFGFGKTLEHNFRLMAHLEDLMEMDLPMLVGVSRKSMIYKLLGVTPAEALCGTVVLNTIALTKGAQLLRVHDVREATEAVRIFTMTQQQV